MLILLLAASIYGSYTRDILIRKQCLMFMLLLAAFTAVTQKLHLDEKTMPHVYVIVSRIYGSYTKVIS